jgi:hypothetical protein
MLNGIVCFPLTSLHFYKHRADRAFAVHVGRTCWKATSQIFIRIPRKESILSMMRPKYFIIHIIRKITFMVKKLFLSTKRKAAKEFT